jgi:hypothetical protein
VQREDDYFKSLVPGRLWLISKTIHIRTCPVLSFLLISTYKEKNLNRKSSSCPPLLKKKNGNLKALFRKLAYGRT